MYVSIFLLCVGLRLKGLIQSLYESTSLQSTDRVRRERERERERESRYFYSAVSSHLDSMPERNTNTQLFFCYLFVSSVVLQPAILSSMTDKGQRRLVLTEEDYISNLSSIVARDFFPDVSKLQRQNALLDRRLEGDLAGAIAVRRATRRLIQDEENAATRREKDDHDITGETSKSVVVGSKTETHKGRPIRKRPRPLEEESLTGFVARATNEDDHEFDSNLKRDIKANRQRISEFYGTSNEKNDKNNTESSPNLHLEMASDDFAPESNRIEWKNQTMRNSLFFNPTPINAPSQNYHGTIDQEIKLIEGPVAQSVETEERSLMPPPSEQQTSGILSIHKAERQNALHLPKSELVEYIPKHNLQKKIQPIATRFPSKGSLLAKIGSNSGNGITGEEIDSASDTDYMSEVSTDLDAPLRSVEEERRRFQSKKKSDGRSYVAMTPLIIPGAGSVSPITTWGTIDGTPIVLSGNGEPMGTQSSFRMPDQSERESAANKADLLMAKRTKLASSSSKAKKKRSNSDRSSSLTPAALSLFEKTKGSQSRGSAFVSSLRTSYTPLPSSSASRKHSGKTRRRRDHAYNTTPQI